MGTKLDAMSWVKQKESVDLDQFQNIDEDSLVEALSPEELADLNAAIDPEVRIILKKDMMSLQWSK